MEIAGIAISEGRLLAMTILFTVLLLVLVAAFIVSIHVSQDLEHKKAKDRLRQLKMKSNKGPSTYRKIQKLERQMQKKKDNRRADWLIDGVCILAIVATLAFCVIPGWTDYARKDYAVYEGAFTCEFREKTCAWFWMTASC